MTQQHNNSNQNNGFWPQSRYLFSAMCTWYLIKHAISQKRFKSSIFLLYALICSFYICNWDSLWIRRVLEFFMHRVFVTLLTPQYFPLLNIWGGKAVSWPSLFLALEIMNSLWSPLSLSLAVRFTRTCGTLNATSSEMILFCLSEI